MKHINDELNKMGVQNMGIMVGSNENGVPMPTCETCGGIGWVTVRVPVEHPLFGKPQACPNPDCKAGNEARERAEKSKVKGGGLPIEYRGITFESFEAMPDDKLKGKWLARFACELLARRNFVSIETINQAIGRNNVAQILQVLGMPAHTNIFDQRCIVVLYGPPNRGKTGLACAAVSCRRNLELPSMYVRCIDMFESIKMRFGAEEYPKSEDVILDYKGKTPFLVIDEAGVKGETDWRLDTFDTIIRGRAANHLPTILTTNLSPAQFEQEWGTQAFAITNRQGFWIPVNGLPLRDERVTTTKPKADWL